ncbi:MAG: MJ0042-type zinc finger domain-containing protein [Caulobacteraceae bacterium]
MILTCPECATGYFVQDGQIGPGGRAVRCAACGARWTAFPDAPLDLVPPDEGAAADKDADRPPADAPAAADDLPRAFRGRAEEEKRLKRAAAAGVAWAGAAVVVAALLAAAVLMRESVVRAWPRTA